VRMRRTLVAVALAAAATVPAVSIISAPAVAGSAKPAKPVATKPVATKPTKAPKPTKVAFAANGSVTAVNAGSALITVAVKSGTKDVKGRTVTISVPPGARVVVNGAGKTLSAVAAGYRITVTGTHVGSLYTAAKIQAQGVRPQPAPSAKPVPTPTPTPAPVETEDPATQPTSGLDEDGQ
jgi:hypothetical protein